MGRICSQERYKKKISSYGDISVSINDLKNRRYFTIKEFISHTVIETKPTLNQQISHSRGAATNFVSPKTDINIEKNRLRKIKNGRISIDGKLDLHGFSLKEAENQLKLFVEESYRLRRRFLLIITGKGSNSKPNIHGKIQTIKSEIYSWVSERFYHDKVQYISKALDRHGGEGAYYFFLKKSKDILS